MRRLSAEERKTTLNIGRLNMLLWYLWGKPAGDEPLWERLVTTAFFFAMGVVQVFSAIMGVYFSQAIIWLGYWHSHSICKIENFLGVKKDQDQLERIVDPRNRAEALAAIRASYKARARAS